MTPNPDRNDERTRHATTDEPNAEVAGDDDADEESTASTLTRRRALVGAGVGLGLLHGSEPRRAGAGPRRKGSRPWNRDVDARGNRLLDLGGLSTTGMDEGAVIADFAGNNLSIDDNRLNAVTQWERADGLLEPAADDVDGIEVEDVESPERENLRVESDADLVLSISGAQGAVRIETPGGHEIVLDDEDGSESLSIEDSAGNSVEMDATTGEVSVSATERITLDAPEIDLSADENVTVESTGSVNVESDGTTRLQSAGLLRMNGAIVSLNGPGGSPAARLGDPVEDGTITFGSPSVLIG
jgi:hypothetical protein